MLPGLPTSLTSGREGHLNREGSSCGAVVLDVGRFDGPPASNNVIQRHPVERNSEGPESELDGNKLESMVVTILSTLCPAKNLFHVAKPICPVPLGWNKNEDARITAKGLSLADVFPAEL